MKRIAFAAGLVLVAAALAGVLRPEGASAVDPAPSTDSVTVTGTGVVAAGANTIYGPSLSRSDADALYDQALEKAVADAKERAALLAKAAGRELGRVTALVESGASETPMFAAKREAAADAGTPVVSGGQETSASVSVTYELR